MTLANPKPQSIVRSVCSARKKPRSKALTARINTATRAPEKALIARELLREVNVLLDCASFDRSNRNCALCRNFSELRRKAATLLVEVGALGAAPR